MKKLNIFLIIFLIISVKLFASPYDMILVGDPVIEDIRFISLESGRSILSFTPPFAPHEIEDFLNRIDESNLSAPAKQAYNRVRNRLILKTPLSLSWKNFSLSLNVNLTLEGKARFNTDIDWYPYYPKIPSLLSVPLKIFFAETLQLYVDPAVGIDPFDYNKNGYFANNIVFLGDNDIHGNSPFRTFVAAGGSWWNFQLGRDRLSFGTGISGNLSIADNPPFYEFMRLSFFSKNFKYSLIVNQTPLRVTEALYKELDIDPDYFTSTTQRYFYLSRIDCTLFNVLSLSVSEGVMAGNSALELRYFNPLMIFHNIMTWRDYDNWPGAINGGGEGHLNGSFFSAEINWHIIKSLSAYGQFVMTELAIGPELNEGNKERQNPNAIGYLFGLQYSHSFNNWGSVFYLECIHTSPFLYINPSPFASIIYMHVVEFVHPENYYYYFGYPRDTFALTAGARFFYNDILTISGEFSWIASGKRGGYPIVWKMEIDHSWAPSGIPENNFILSIGAEWKLYQFLTINANVTGIYSQNYNHGNEDKTGGQISLSVSFHY